MITKQEKILTTFGLAIAFAALTPSASAHETRSSGGSPVRYSGNSCHFKVDTLSMSSGFRSAFQAALNEWNKVPANFLFTMNSTSLWAPFSGNLQNEVWMSNNRDLLGTALAVCVTWRVGAQLMESDIVFSNSVMWTTGMSRVVMSAYGGSGTPFRAVALHELGHALGLLHESDTYNVMGDATKHLQTNGSTARSYVGEDATHGAIFLYGLLGGRQDVAVCHWRRTGSWSGYSTHDRTRVLVGGVEAGKVNSSAAEPVYEVRRGQWIDLEMTYENNGSSSQRPLLRFYVSTNNFISGGDRWMASRNITVNRNKVYTARHRLQIPTNLRLGTNYWLGVIIDANSRIAEFDESNNASYVGIRIIP